jgi:hypothetical protein
MATIYASVNRKGKAQLVSVVNCFTLQQHNTAYGRHVSTILLALICAGAMRRDPDLLSQAHLGDFGIGRRGGTRGRWAGTDNVWLYLPSNIIRVINSRIRWARQAARMANLKTNTFFRSEHVKERVNVEDLGAGRIILKSISKNQGVSVWVQDWVQWRARSTTFGFIKSAEFLGQLSDCQTSRKGLLRGVSSLAKGRRWQIYDVLRNREQKRRPTLHSIRAAFQPRTGAQPTTFHAACFYKMCRSGKRRIPPPPAFVVPLHALVQDHDLRSSGITGE